MRGAGGMLAVAAVTLLVCCNADPHQEQVSPGDHSAGDRFNANGHKTRNLDPLGGGNLVRQVRQSRHPGWIPYMVARQLEYDSPYNGKRDIWQYGSNFGDDLPKRNFDEIDRSGLDNFVKRNFDEIDQTSMPFPYATKRFARVYNPNSIEAEKRKRPDYPMDEIDLSRFPIGGEDWIAKLPYDKYPLMPRALR